LIRTIGRALGNVRRRPALAIVAIGAMSVGLVLVGVVRLAGRNLESATDRWGAGVQMVVYLEDGTSPERVARIVDALDQLPAVSGTRYVSEADALARLRESLGEEDELVAGIEADMMPASIEVSLREGVRDVAAGHPVVERLEHVPGVEEVQFPGAWVDRMTTLSSALSYAAWFLLLLVAIASAYIVAASLRLALAGRRAEVRTLELLGASRSFVRAPMLVEGMLQGVAAAVVSLAALWALFRAAAEPVGAAMGAAFGTFDVTFLPASDVLGVVAFGAALGLVGSWLASGHRVVTAY
jgi:cell division transport system permease protein